MYRPLVDFMIVGAQKGGTTALAHFLSQHPEIGLSSPKEVHLFDAPEYSPDWTAEQIDEHYRRYFEHCADAAVRGEATPIYMHLPDVACELKRYNPNLKLIVLLRDPVERAISNYYMQKTRDREHRPLWLALLSEPFRLRGDKDARHPRSAAREYAYRRRGLYSLQLRNLYRFFDSRGVLVIQARDLRQRHDAVLSRIFEFLGVSPDVRVPRQVVFEGVYDGQQHRVLSWLLRLTYLVEFVRLRAILVKTASRETWTH